MAQEKNHAEHIERDSITDKKDPDTVVAVIEDVSPAGIQAQFSTLRDLNDEEMKVLKKKLVRRLDWRLMPCITIMFLLK